jgi:hypothetical protein
MAETAVKGEVSHLHERDFYSWSLEQARALRERRLGALDLENLADEVENLAKTEGRALTSYTARILEHFWKLAYWPWLLDHNARIWRAEVDAYRGRAARLLRGSPGLKRILDQVLEDAWDDARAELVKEAAKLSLSDSQLSHSAELGKRAYPASCPWTFDQTLDPDFWLATVAKSQE